MDIIDIKQKKKDMVIEFCKQGADFDTACTASDITTEEKELLIQDEDFVNYVNYSLAKREMDLLRKLNECAEKNIEPPFHFHKANEDKYTFKDCADCK